MDSKKAYSSICGYFEYLKSMGSANPCDMKKQLIVPLLADFNEGPLSIFKTAEDSTLIRKVELSYFL